jgi:hypothetical protein
VVNQNSPIVANLMALLIWRQRGQVAMGEGMASDLITAGCQDLHLIPGHVVGATRNEAGVHVKSCAHRMGVQKPCDLDLIGGAVIKTEYHHKLDFSPDGTAARRHGQEKNYE